MRHYMVSVVEGSILEVQTTIESSFRIIKPVDDLLFCAT